MPPRYTRPEPHDGTNNTRSACLPMQRRLHALVSKLAPNSPPSLTAPSSHRMKKDDPDSPSPSAPNLPVAPMSGVNHNRPPPYPHLPCSTSHILSPPNVVSRLDPRSRVERARRALLTTTQRARGGRGREGRASDALEPHACKT